MGNIVQGKLEPILKKYTYNFENKQIKFSMFKGTFELDNLILNDQEINKMIQQKDLPFSLKFGVLKKFKLKVSVLSRKLEILEVDSLILILGEKVEVKDEKLKLEQEQSEEILLKIYENQFKTQTFENSSNLFLDEKKLYEDFLKGEQNQEIKEKEKLKKLEQKNKENMNFFAVELIDIIKNLLDCKIRIENIYIVYENNLDFLVTKDKQIDLKSFNFTIYLKELEFSSKDLKKSMVNGVFKNYMNLVKFQEQSGILGQANSAYWALNTQSFQVYFGSGNFKFYDETMQLEKRSHKEMSEIIAIFVDKFQKNKSFSYDLINLQQQSFDLILFYKETSQIPLNAIFINLDIKKVIFNFKIQKVELLLDVLAHFNNIQLIKQFEFFRPKVWLMNEEQKIAFINKYRVREGNHSKIKRINYYIIRDYMMQVYWLMKYRQYIDYGMKPQQARVLTLKKYCKSSSIYQYVYGNKLPQWLENVSFENIVESIDQKRVFKKEKKKSAGTQMAEFNFKIKNDYLFKVLSKIHFHIRAGFNLRVSLFSRQSQVIDQNLEMKDLFIDFSKPTGILKFNFMLQLVEFNLSASHRLLPNQNNQRIGIFQKSQVQQQHNNSFQINKGQAIISFKNMSIQSEIQFQQSKSGNLILLVFSENQLGEFQYNYFPTIFFDLMKNLIDVQRCLKKNFRISFNNMLIKSKLNKKGNQTQVRMKTLIQQMKDQQNNMPRKSLQETNIYEITQSQREQKIQKEQDLERQLEELNSMLSQVVISIKGVTQPISIKIYDKANNEQIQLKYNNQTINVDIDLVTKGVVSIQAFGMEIQSKKSIQNLKVLFDNLLQDVNKIKSFHQNEFNNLYQEELNQSQYQRPSMMDGSMRKSQNQTLQKSSFINQQNDFRPPQDGKNDQIFK